MMARRTILIRVLTLLISGILSRKASANGFRLPDQDAFATARGEAFVATADNPSAIYYNPAGLTQLEGSNLRGGLYGIYVDSSFTPPSVAFNHGQTYNNQDYFAAIPQIFYAYTPTNMPLSFGLGVYAPFGGKSSWPQDTGFRTVALDGSLTYVTINPAVAYKLLPSLSIGGGVMVNYAKMELGQGLISSYLPPNINFFRFTGDGWSVGYNLGVLWQPHENISIGANFRSSATVTLNGQTEFEQFGVAGFYPATSRSAHTDLQFPLTATVGISYRPTSNWNVEFDADYTDWSSFGSTTIHQANPPAPMSPDGVSLTLDWQASWMYELGATRYFVNGWHASAGVVYNGNSVPNTYYSPIVADMDRYFFSTGIGYKGKQFSCDIAYQFGYGPTHTVTGSTPSSTPASSSGENANGNYDFISHALMVSLGWHF